MSGQTEKRIKGKPMYRGCEIVRKLDDESRTMQISFSSETEVDRWFGKEVLDHKPKSVRTERLSETGNLLLDHDITKPVGKVTDVEIKGHRGYATVELGSGFALADETFLQVQQGIRRNVSVGYRVHKLVMDETSETGEGPDIYRAVDWEPYEISLVTVPADPSVGVNRSPDDEYDITILETKQMEDGHTTGSDAAAGTQSPAAPAQGLSDAELNQIRERATKAERDRIDDINAIATRFDVPELAADFIKTGKSVDEFNRAMLAELEKRDIDIRPVQNRDVGLTRREARNFSFVRAIRAMAFPEQRRFQEEAAFERECSQAAEKAYERTATGFLVPEEVATIDMYSRGEVDLQSRDLTAGTTTEGGDTIATDLRAGDFIELLRNEVAVERMGATTLRGLQGNIAIPRQTGGATAYWVAEGAAPTESQQAFDQVTLTPTTIGAFTDFTRRLLLQSSIDIEAFVRGDLAAVMGVEIDRAYIEGDPDTTATQYEVRGILNVSGIGSVAHGTNGGVPTRNSLIDLITALATANALRGNPGYLMSSRTIGFYQKLATDTGSGLFVMDGRDSVLGLPVGESNNVPDDLTKGSGSALSAIIFGNFRDFITGWWSGIDILVDPYTSSTTGTIRVVALQDIDAAVRHAESFAATVDANTA